MESQEERIIVVYRKTILFLFWAITKTILLLIIPTIFYYYLKIFEIVRIVYYIFLALIFLYFLAQFFKWYFSTIVLTTKRIIKTEQKGILSKKVSEVDFNDIYSVSYKISGFLATIFNYGDLVLEIKNTYNKFFIKNLPKPSFIRDIILKIKEI